MGGGERSGGGSNGRSAADRGARSSVGGGAGQRLKRRGAAPGAAWDSAGGARSSAWSSAVPAARGKGGVVAAAGEGILSQIICFPFHSSNSVGECKVQSVLHTVLLTNCLGPFEIYPAPVSVLSIFNLLITSGYFLSCLHSKDVTTFPLLTSTSLSPDWFFPTTTAALNSPCFWRSLSKMIDPVAKSLLQSLPKLLAVSRRMPGMVTTDLLMSGANTKQAKFFINVLAEPAEVVCSVPRSQHQSYSHKWIWKTNLHTFPHRTESLLSDILTQRLAFGARRNRYFLED
ncbi:Chlorophyll(ide) b reductase NOL, chloroplastic [Sesamum angolense]|uniref:Chlorophyll(Ide) b reductase NOL, chloroplastic n=1 Tax=Sesamum angolense TaxID=2727404 RepID=A0AAE2C2G6_9LAMI|nr:Chlorophyll(ide) b reductase NOL, chloroplastic [Sesamum angolense]